MLHESLTEARDEGVVAAATVSLRLDTSSRFYVFDQPLDDVTRTYGVAIGNPCATSEAQFLAAARTWCPPLQPNRPPSQCTRPPSGGRYISLYEIPTYCLTQGRGVPTAIQCPNDNCSGRCALELPAECMDFRHNTGAVVGNPVRIASRYDRSVPIQWAQLPYTGGVSGPEETVQLITATGAPWPYTPRSVRNYDLGACGAFVTWQQLTSLVNETFFRSYAQQVFGLRTDEGVPRVRRALRLLSELKVGPTLGGRGWLLRNDAVQMWFRTDAELDVEDFTFNQHVHPYGNVFLAVSITTRPDATGRGRRLAIDASVAGAISAPGQDPRTRPNFSATIANAIRGNMTNPGLAQILADTVNRGFLQPFQLDPTRPTTFIRCAASQIGTLLGSQRCQEQMDFAPSLISGPEYGCHSEDEFGEAVRARLLKDPDRLTRGTGVCATRLQPQRVNVLPDELEIVLVEREDTPVPGSPGLASRREMRDFFRTALARMRMQAGSMQFRLSCDDQPDWNLVSTPGRIVQTGTIATPASDLRECTSALACDALRPMRSP